MGFEKVTKLEDKVASFLEHLMRLLQTLVHML